MIRLAAVVLLLTAAAPAGPELTFVDGEQFAVRALLSMGPERTRVKLRDGRTWEFPTTNLVSIRLSEAAKSKTQSLYNLYLVNRDRLHGTVTGEGDHFKLSSASIQGLRVSLPAIRAVRFGRLLHGLQSKYDEVFRAELGRGRDAVIVQRDTRPFPIAARVLGVSKKSLTVMVGDDRRDLPLHKVYGFVRRAPEPEMAAAGVRARIHMAKGAARVTLPLKRIGIDGWIQAGGALIKRDAVQLIEFAGAHIANLAEFDPIAVEERGLFGKARTWRRDTMVLGGPLHLEGREYERGIGVHAYSRLEFALGKRWRSFFVRCGIDDAAGGEGEAIFRILGDGKLLREVTCRRRGQDSAQPILLDVSDVDRLVLEAVPGSSYTSDLCDWAEARVFHSEPIQYPKNRARPADAPDNEE